MCLRRVILPTEAAILPHEDTYCRLAQAGVHPYAVTNYVLQQIVGPDDVSLLEMYQTDTHELAQGLLEYLSENLHVDLNKIDMPLYEDMVRAVNDLYAAIMSVRAIIFGTALPGEFVSGIAAGTFQGADMMVVVEITQMRSPHATAA